MRYITQLTEEEKRKLNSGFRTGCTHRFRIRCQSILLSAEGYRIGQLAKMFEVERDTISRWLNQWEQKGLSGLEDKPRSGRPAKLRIDNAEHIEQVIRRVSQESQSLDKVRAQLADDLQVEVSRKTLKRFLKKLVTDGDASAYR